MKFSSILAVAGLPSVLAFTPGRPPVPSTVSSSALFISSYGPGASKNKWGATVKKSPAEDIQSYLEEPDAVEARDTIEGSVMVSGLVNSKERTDQTIFDFLNDEESAFEFDKIVAFVDDEKFAKKRLLSRSARYTGLLDKLAFVQAKEAGAMPVADDLKGIRNWVVFLDDPATMLQKVKEAASLAKEAPDMENIAILLTNANELDVAECAAAVESLKGDAGLAYTLCAVGKLEDHDEGKVPYKLSAFGTEEGVIPKDAIYSRDEALRAVTECLQLECGVNKAFALTEVTETNATEYILVKGLREAGYERIQEFHHMITKGPAALQEAIDEFAKENPEHAKGIVTSDAWWEDPKFKKQLEEIQKAKPAQSDDEVKKDERTLKVEEIAREWAKREYFQQSMAGTVKDDMTEEAFIESVWDRAMFEGDLKYRQLNGEDPDAAAELADFKTRQERKKKAMLERAKKELQGILDEEGLGGEDLEETLSDVKPIDSEPDYPDD